MLEDITRWLRTRCTEHVIVLWRTLAGALHERELQRHTPQVCNRHICRNNGSADAPEQHWWRGATGCPTPYRCLSLCRMVLECSCHQGTLAKKLKVRIVCGDDRVGLVTARMSTGSVITDHTAAQKTAKLQKQRQTISCSARISCHRLRH